MTIPPAGQPWNTFVRGDNLDVVPGLPAGSFDLVYLDPPYTKLQYAGVFHLPETLAREDEPEPVGVGGLPDWSAARSDFCSFRRARQALHDTVKRLEVPLVVVRILDPVRAQFYAQQGMKVVCPTQTAIDQLTDSVLTFADAAGALEEAAR